ATGNSSPAGSPPVPTSSSQPVICEFGQGLANWKVEVHGGSAQGQGSVTAQNGHALLHEGDSFLVSLSRSFQIPAEPSSLRFSYANLSFDQTAQHRIKDAFEAALVDSHGHSLVHTISPGRNAFFNSSESQAPALGSEASLDSQTQTVTLDLSQ